MYPIVTLIIGGFINPNFFLGAGLLLAFVPPFIYYLILIFKDSTPGPNKYGENPKGIQVIEEITHPDAINTLKPSGESTNTGSGYQGGYSGGHNSPSGSFEANKAANEDHYKDGDLYN